MSSSEFDSVKAEKADAIRRYNRKRNFIFYFHRLITAFALLCSFPYFPHLREIFSSYLSLFNRQLYVFFLINAMIFIIYHFPNLATRVSHDGAATSPAATSQPDIYDQYVSLSSTSGLRENLPEEDKKSTVDLPAMESQLPDEDKVCDKQIVLCENAQSAQEEEEKKNSVCDLLETKSHIKIVKDEEIRLRRTRSDRYRIVKNKKTHIPELRRSETENGRELVVTGARKSMEDMNNEEFRFTIECFIANKKKLLRDENFAVVMEERD